jgi:hypothetical protein
VKSLLAAGFVEAEAEPEAEPTDGDADGLGEAEAEVTELALSEALAETDVFGLTREQEAISREATKPKADRSFFFIRANPHFPDG